ncbi:MAG: preprotein translocase subunit SecE [Litorimonas sp.]
MPKSRIRKPKKGKSTTDAAAMAAPASGGGSDTAAAKVGPVKYVGQVRQEARKVVWPTWRETFTTTILVMIIVVIMGVFFFFVDWALASLVRLVLSLGGA